MLMGPQGEPMEAAVHAAAMLAIRGGECVDAKLMKHQWAWYWFDGGADDEHGGYGDNCNRDGRADPRSWRRQCW